MSWEFCLLDGGVSEGFTHKMAAWKFCIQDGGVSDSLPTRWRQCRVSESLTHKMAAWEICLKDGGVCESLEYILRLQCRIYLVNVTWLVVIIMTNGRPWSGEHSIMLNVTWRRFDQSVKQLVVGHATTHCNITLISHLHWLHLNWCAKPQNNRISGLIERWNLCKICGVRTDGWLWQLLVSAEPKLLRDTDRFCQKQIPRLWTTFCTWIWLNAQ